MITLITNQYFDDKSIRAIEKFSNKESLKFAKNLYFKGKWEGYKKDLILISHLVSHLANRPLYVIKDGYVLLEVNQYEVTEYIDIQDFIFYNMDFLELEELNFLKGYIK